MLSLMGTLRWMRTDAVDLEPFVEPTVAGVAHLQRRAIADRASNRLPDDRFFDLHYVQLLADPVAAVGAAYEHFGLALPAELPGAIRAYLASKPKGARGSHRYSPEGFGLTAEGIRAEFRDYIDRFDIEAERIDRESGPHGRGRGPSGP